MSQVIKPRLAKGTRDFSPGDMALRNHIIGIIRNSFKTYGFEQIETPAVENLETLTGKYGDEGDKLIFKILNSGDYLKNISNEEYNEKNSDKLIPLLCEKALRYDLTVPFARYVVQHKNDIVFPFRRYQIQPVWRADRPQKGRYREFFQCDADVIGSNSLLIETEFIHLVNDVFKKLEIKSTLKLNSRKILAGFCEKNQIEDKFVEFSTLLDKLDKKSWDALKSDFMESGFSPEVIANCEKLISFSGKDLTTASVSELTSLTGNSEIGKTGMQELGKIAFILENQPVDYIDVELDLSLARGLNYYTGAIIEVVAQDHHIGSICGGGRYDDLTGIFGLKDVSGIGISFGIDRLFDVMKNQGWDNADEGNKVLLINFGDEVLNYSLQLLKALRNAGIQSEIYPDDDKIKKQFKYADQKNFNFVLIAGNEEVKSDLVKLKNLNSGEQSDIKSGDIVAELLKLL